MNWSKLFLAFNALFWLGFSSYLYLFPQQSANGSLILNNSTAISDVMATYGGLQGAIGVMLLWGVIKPEAQQTALWISACTYTCLAITRGLSIVITGDQSVWTLGGTGFELINAAIAFLLLRQAEKPVTA